MSTLAAHGGTFTQRAALSLGGEQRLRGKQQACLSVSTGRPHGHTHVNQGSSVRSTNAKKGGAALHTALPMCIHAH